MADCLSLGEILSQHPTAVNVLQPHTAVNVLSWALGYAERGIPIFPCKADKRPHTRNGFKAATTNREQIIQWWTRWPEANIAMPTGSRSGYVIIDHDTYKPGSWSRADLERNLGPLTDTITVRTGSDGLQYHYWHPGGLKGVPENILGPGVCIKAEGGYVILPPSRTTGVYEYLSREPAELPKWCEELLRERTAKPEAGVKGSGKKLHVVDDGAPIPYGRRNDTLALIARRRHDGTQSLAEFTADLERINRERCQPPIGTHPEDHEPEEVARIAAAAHRLKPYHECGGGPDQDTLDFLRDFEELAEGDAWKGHRRGRQSLLKTYILQARRYGYMVEDGVAVSMSNMQAAEHNGVSDRAVRNNNRRLVAEGYIRHANATRKPLEAGTIILLSSALPTAGAQTFLTYPLPSSSTTSLGTVAREPEGRPWTAPRARHSRGVYEGLERIGTIRRMGKSAESAVDVLEHVGGRLRDTELAEFLGMRVRDLYRQNGWLSRLEEAGVVEVSEGYISLTGSWLEFYNDRRDQDLEIEDFYRAVKRHNERRETYREGIEVRKLARVMDDEQIAATMDIGIERVRHHLGRKRLLERMVDPAADGFIEDLECVEESEDLQVPELTDEDREVLEAIEEYEVRYGAGTFKWNQAAAKELFYMVGPWPDQEQLEKIQTYVAATDERRAA